MARSKRDHLKFYKSGIFANRVHRVLWVCKKRGQTVASSIKASDLTQWISDPDVVPQVLIRVELHICYDVGCVYKAHLSFLIDLYSGEWDIKEYEPPPASKIWSASEARLMPTIRTLIIPEIIGKYYPIWAKALYD